MPGSESPLQIPSLLLPGGSPDKVLNLLYFALLILTAFLGIIVEIKKKKDKSKEKNEELPNERQMKTEMNEEKDLKEMRRKVQKCLDEAWIEIEQILDSIKPSVYAENINTYKKTIEILEVLKNMKYPMDNNSGIEDK